MNKETVLRYLIKIGDIGTYIIVLFVIIVLFDTMIGIKIIPDVGCACAPRGALR